MYAAELNALHLGFPFALVHKYNYNGPKEKVISGTALDSIRHYHDRVVIYYKTGTGYWDNDSKTLAFDTEILIKDKE